MGESALNEKRYNMPKAITLRLTDEQYKEISDGAAEHKTTISDYAMTVLCPETYTTDNTKLTIEAVLYKAEKLNSGEEFTIPQLFEESEWAAFTNVSTIERVFYINCKRPGSAVNEIVAVAEGKEKQKPLVYVRL